MKRVRLLLWVLVALAVAGIAALLLAPRAAVNTPGVKAATQRSLGGPFTLVDGHGRLFSSEKLAGKPYAIYFGFTRCGDICPTTLSRLVKLRREAAGDATMRIVFVTIDPEHDGPGEVGQYTTLFDAPIIGLTGSQARIDQVKKQYGIYAEPEPHAAMGKEMAHTATVLLFDRNGRFVTTISPEESDSSALDKLRRLAT
jgi:protein SCO1/2